MAEARIDDRGRAAWQSYRRMRDSVDAEVARDLERACGLSVAEFEVLDALSALETPDGCIRVHGLAAHLGWAHSRLSRLLGRMEQRGLVTREPCERDGRGDDVLLAPDGRAALEAAVPVYFSSVQTRFAGLLTKEQLGHIVAIEQAVTSTDLG